MSAYEMAEVAASSKPGTGKCCRAASLRWLAGPGMVAIAGVAAILLPSLLIAANWIAAGKVIVPSSMSGSYYTSARGLFIGLLCALGVFLIFWVQYICALLAGVAALVVAFCPTAPPPGIGTEPACINYVHHIAAGALIFTLGIFCFVLQRSDAAGMAKLGTPSPADLAGSGARPRVPRWRSVLYFVCGGLVLLSGGFALYTDVWPTSWSSGWQSVYLFEAVAVVSFGIAWITAAAVRATTIQKRVVADRALAGAAKAVAAANKTIRAPIILARIVCGDETLIRVKPRHKTQLSAALEFHAPAAAGTRLYSSGIEVQRLARSCAQRSLWLPT